jgi:hypothetical protein
MSSTNLWIPRTEVAPAPRRWATHPLLVAMAQGAVLVLMAALVLWPATIDRRILPAGETYGDILISHWPDSLVIQRSMEEDGRLPLWNPTFGAGRPVGADPLAAMWYPPSSLVHLLPLRDYFYVLMFGHLVLAGAGMLLIARRILHLAPIPALVAALAFELSPRMLGHLGAGHLTMIQAVAWLPWLVYTAWLAVRRDGWGTVALALVVAMLLLAGHPQMVFYGAMLAVPWVGYLLIAQWHTDGPRAALRSVGGLALAGAVALLLAAIHLVPLLELMDNSTRQDAIRSDEATGLWSFMGALLGREIPSPNAHEMLFGPGLIVLALALIGAWERRRTAWPLVLGIVLVASLALGNASPLYQGLTVVIPGLDRFRSLGRVWFVALIPIGLLAGYGTVALIAQMRAAAPRAAWMVGLATLVLVATTLLWQGNRMIHADDVTQNTVLSAMEFRAARLAGKHRIYGVQRNMRQVAAAIAGARLADGWDPLLLQPYVRFMQRAGGYRFSGYQLTVPPYQIYDPAFPTYRRTQPDAALLGLVDVEAVLSRTPLRDARFEFVAGFDGTSLYRNTANQGPAYMVAANADGTPPSIDAIKHLDARVAVRERNPEHLDITATTETGGYLVIGSPAYPGWTATVDGTPTTVQTVEGVLPAIRLEAGKHRVTFRYEPATQRLGIWLSLGGMALLAGWIATRSMLKARRRPMLTKPIGEDTHA